jgi:hypothetical protein
MTILLIYILIGGYEMRLKFKEKYVAVNPKQEEYFSSLFTGNQLKRLQVAITVNNLHLSIFENELDYVKVHGITEVDDDGSKLRKFNISNTSYSYSNNSDDTTYSFELSEEEELRINKLIINDIELIPYEYKETLSDDAIIIYAKVAVSKEIAEHFELVQDDEDKYFSVIREGINENPIRMRFGMNIWSEHESDVLKYRLVLVEEKYDTTEESKSRSLNYPVLENIQSMTLQHKTYIDLLSDLFIEKGLLSREEIEEIKEKAAAERYKNSRYIYRVKDVDNEDL